MRFTSSPAVKSRHTMTLATGILIVAISMAAACTNEADNGSAVADGGHQVEVVEVASQERTTIGTFEPQAAIQEAGNVVGYELPLDAQYGDDLQLEAITIQRAMAMGDGEGPITFVQLDYTEGGQQDADRGMEVRHLPRGVQAGNSDDFQRTVDVAGTTVHIAEAAGQPAHEYLVAGEENGFEIRATELDDDEVLGYIEQMLSSVG